MFTPIDSDEMFRPLDLSDLPSRVRRLRDYGLETRHDLRTGNLYTDRLLDSAWTDRNGFDNVTSKRLHLMYLHLYGTSGQTVRDEIDGVDRSQARERLLEFDWQGVGLATVIDEIDKEARRRQALLREKLPSGRIPLLRGLHCMNPGDDAAETALQHWAATIVRKGVLDGSVQVDVETAEPSGYVLGVEPFTSTVDSWTCSYNGARHWSRSRLPGNEICMAMAASVAHQGVVLWRNDSGAMDEVLVLGGGGTVNVYFVPQDTDKATADEMAPW